jgi:hypothetical protein
MLAGMVCCCRLLGMLCVASLHAWLYWLRLYNRCPCILLLMLILLLADYSCRWLCCLLRTTMPQGIEQGRPGPGWPNRTPLPAAVVLLLPLSFFLNLPLPLLLLKG